MRAVVTGGAGFIGRHLAFRLLREGWEVTIADSFSPGVHGPRGRLPLELARAVRLVEGDVRDERVIAAALDGCHAVLHLAAETGTGQSMYSAAAYESVNVGSTARIIDYLTSTRGHAVERLILASSRAVYGEGRWSCAQDGAVYPEPRRRAQLEAGRFDPRCPLCAGPCVPVPTDEDSPVSPSSFYGATKAMQEQAMRLLSLTLDLPACVLRYQNVYGPGQALRNPYTGVLSLFASRTRQRLPIQVFEDGRPSRDFVYIDDVVEATWRSLQADLTGMQTLNVGSGVATSIHTVAEQLREAVGSDAEMTVTGEFRLGDIRYSCADLTRAQAVIGYEPRWDLTAGLEELLAWVEGETVEPNAYESSLEEMRSRGLMGQSTSPR